MQLHKNSPIVAAGCAVPECDENTGRTPYNDTASYSCGIVKVRGSATGSRESSLFAQASDMKVHLTLMAWRGSKVHSTQFRRPVRQQRPNVRVESMWYRAMHARSYGGRCTIDDWLIGPASS